MDKDKVLSHIRVNEDRTVDYTEYVGGFPYSFFGKRPHTIENIVYKFRGRCFEEGRPDKYELLAYLGLKEYSSLDIVRATHGRMTCDSFWVKFQGEDLYFNDLNKE
jgi:hypothetical protein